MNVHRLVQCYRCRRLFVPRGGRMERYCPECWAELKRRLAFGAGGQWATLFILIGTIAGLLLLSGRRLLPTLLASAIVIAWYAYQRRDSRF